MHEFLSLKSSQHFRYSSKKAPQKSKIFLKKTPIKNEQLMSFPATNE